MKQFILWSVFVIVSLGFLHWCFTYDTGPPIKIRTIQEVESEIVIPEPSCDTLIERAQRQVLLFPTQKNWNAWAKISIKCQQEISSENDSGL